MLCDHDNAILPIPRSQEENEWYRTNFDDQYVFTVWLGITKVGTTGLWQGDDGSDISWFNWRSNNPKSGNDEPNVQYSKGSGEWTNVSLDNQQNNWAHTYCVFLI